VELVAWLLVLSQVSLRFVTRGFSHPAGSGGFPVQIKARLYVLTYSQNGDDKNIKTQKAATYVGTKK